MMLAQNDIKKTLGFSTIGQMGYMIMECGLGAFSLAVFHLIAHGLFKATVFLNCGNVIHKARQEPHFPHVDHQADEEGLSRLTWFDRIRDHALHSPADSLGHARGPAHSTARITGDGHFPLLHLDYLIASHPDPHALAPGRVLESVGRDAHDAVVHRVRLSGRRGSLHRLSLSEPGRSGVVFQGGGLPDWMFDLIILLATVLTIASWSYLYLIAHGRTVRMPAWIEGLRIRLYLPFMNRLYADEMYQLLGNGIMRLVHQLDKRERGWSR